jgi:hypothetical protein
LGPGGGVELAAAVQGGKRVAQVVDELEELIRRYLLDELGPDPSGELFDAELASVVITYLNWRTRFIARRARNVHLASELVASTKYAENRAAVDEMERKIRTGEDLRAHLSRSVATAYIPRASRPSKAHRRADLDLLVAEWGVHHLHLSTTVDATDGFVTRSKDLLFGHFAEHDAYLIGIFSHGAWAAKEIARICVRNWPAAEIFYEARGVVGLAQPDVDDGARLDLRNAGATSLLEIDGKVYMPRGQSTAGTPIHATQFSNHLMHELRRLRKALTSEPAKLVSDVGGDLAGHPPEWEAVRLDDTFAVRERATQVMVWRCNF